MRESLEFTNGFTRAYGVIIIGNRVALFAPVYNSRISGEELLSRACMRARAAIV